MPMTFHRDRLSRPRIVAFCLLAMIFVTQANAATCRVSTQGSTSNNGATWAAPMSLQKALSTASCTEIWVAQGIYKPTTGTDRSISFNIRPNVQVYGGFAGNETTRNQRNPIARATILSGDIGIPNDISDNSIRVVTMDGTTAAGIINNNTVLDGFTIRDGNAWDDTTSTNGSGGGLRCLGRWAGNECSPTLRQLIFVDNRASWGGALHNDGSRGGISSPTMSDVSFSNNIARFNGGAMLNSAGGLATEPTGTSSPVLNNVEFIGNHANWTGGAMVNDGGDNGVSSPRITNAAFIDNNADISAGAMANDAGRAGVSSPALSNVKFINNIAAKWGGAVWNDAFGTDSTASATFQDVVFHGNGAELGGAIYNRAQLSGTSKALFRGVTFSNNNAILGGAINNYGTEAGDSSPIFANVTFSGNSATSDGGAIYNQGGKSNSTVPGTSSPKLTNVTLHGNSASRGGDLQSVACRWHG